MRFETPEDQQREQELADYLASRWGCQALRQEQGAEVDYLLVRSDKKAWLECRVRDITRRQFRTLNVTANKVLKMWYRQRLTGCPVIFAVWFLDAVGYVTADDLMNTRLVLWGRANKRVEQDVCPSVEVPIERFKWLC